MHITVPKRWVIAESDAKKVEFLSSVLKVKKILSSLLVLRGLNTFEEAEKFFNPSLEDLHYPFLMKNMSLAVQRIEQAIQHKEGILIYGDYDVDGTTSVSLVQNFLIPIHPHIDFYIPDRYTEGYGISLKGIDYAVEQNIGLVIALDCGIRAVDQIEYAKEKGVDFIICDHHTPGSIIPDALAVLDPKQTDCPYPYKELSGCGIGFKLCQALAIKLGIDLKKVYEQLDILVVSIASDIVPITGENRTLAWFGLKKLNDNPQAGLKTLLELIGRKKPLHITDIVFGIGPHINAAGRLKHGRYPVLLLTSQKAGEIMQLSQQLHQLNTDRKQLDQAITADALEQLRATPDNENQKSSVVWGKDWHKGVVGIVASRLIEYYYRPTIVLTEDDGYLSGSARSVAGFNILEAIESCSQWLHKYGGHKYAAGLSMKKKHFESFNAQFNQYVSEHIPADSLFPKIRIDTEVKFSDLTLRFYHAMSRMAPFGPGNMNPVFLAKRLSCRWQASIVGEGHLKLSLIQDGVTMPAIAFNQGNKLSLVNAGPFDICFSINLNEWNGKSNLQLNIKDIRPCE